MFTTACFKDEIDFAVNELKIDSIKIASSDIGEEDLIRYAASKGINIQIDTGNSNLWEIEKAVNIIQNQKNNNIIIEINNIDNCSKTNPCTKWHLINKWNY